MSQLLVEQKQELTFEQIVPFWFEYLTTGARQVSYLNIMLKKYCIVGEAHRFSDEYNDICDKCNGFSNDLVDISHILWTKEALESNSIVKEFVKHWNENH